MAMSDREAIFDYIEFDSPMAAVQVDDRIVEQVEALQGFPGLGREGRILGTPSLLFGAHLMLSCIKWMETICVFFVCYTEPRTGLRIFFR